MNMSSKTYNVFSIFQLVLFLEASSDSNPIRFIHSTQIAGMEPVKIKNVLE
jgi:hypothetical protein